MDSFDVSMSKHPSYYKVLFGLFTSYICGEYEKMDTINFILEYSTVVDNILLNSDQIYETEESDNLTQPNQPNRSKLNLFFSNWDNYLDEHLTNERTQEVFDKIINEVKNLSEWNDSNIDVKVGKLLFSLSSFRKIIKHQEKQTNGVTYVKKGMFRIFTGLKSVGSYKEYDKYLLAIEPLLDDVSCHNKLVDHISDILDANIAYTYEDLSFVSQKLCSNNTFNLFIQRILFELIKKYDLDIIINTLNANTLNADDVVYKYFIKLYNTLINSLAITHLYMLKKYFIYQASLASIYKLVGFSNGDKKKTIKEIQKLVKFFDEESNEFIQKIFINACYLSSVLDNENLYLNLITFIDNITAFTNTEVFYGKINSDIYKCLVYVVGNMENKKINQHVRYFACSVILKVVKTEGFNCFNNIFENLFRYVSEVKFFDWSHPDDSIDHYYKLVELLCMLVDFYKKEFDESTSIVSEVLYILLKYGIKIFEEIHDICESLKKKGVYNWSNTSYFNKLVGAIEMTLILHKNIYECGIIKKIYPEVEHIYSIFINELLVATLDYNYELYTFLGRPELAAKITKISLASIISHIKFCHTYLQSIDKTIIEAFERFGYNVDEKERQNVIDLLSSKKTNIDYPSEFLDPLMATPILDPVKIPNVEDIFDKVGIVTHIHNSKENPYTREPLTIQTLEEYNKRPEIIESIQLFLKKKEEFEKEYFLQKDSVNF